MEWVIDGKLARSSRPGYGGEHGSRVARTDVDSWIEEVKRFGIQSIICFLHNDHLHLYKEIPGGLITYYREKGFTVSHIPVLDYQNPPLTPEDLKQVEDAYQAMPKPVLVHCSAGIDRTGQAVRYLRERYSM